LLVNAPTFTHGVSFSRASARVLPLQVKQSLVAARRSSFDSVPQLQLVQAFGALCGTSQPD
jgi:hypothetical protein